MWCDGVWADGVWADGVWPYYGTNEPEPEPEPEPTLRRRKKRVVRIPDDAWDEIIGKREAVTIILG